MGTVPCEKNCEKNGKTLASRSACDILDSDFAGILKGKIMSEAIGQTNTECLAVIKTQVNSGIYDPGPDAIRIVEQCLLLEQCEQYLTGASIYFDRASRWKVAEEYRTLAAACRLAVRQDKPRNGMAGESVTAETKKQIENSLRLLYESEQRMPAELKHQGIDEMDQT